MSFWKTLGKIGRVAVPIAANFIPGVGPLAAAGIGAAFNGITKGGSLGAKAKSALGGAALGYGAGELALNAPKQFGSLGALAKTTGKAAGYAGLGNASGGLDFMKLAALGTQGAGLAGQAQQRKQVSIYNQQRAAAKNALLQQILTPAQGGLTY